MPPTLVELEIEIGHELRGLIGIVLQADGHPARVQSFADNHVVKGGVEMMRKITQSKQWAEYANKNMMTVKFLGGADYAKYLTEERAQLTAVLKSIGKLP